MYILLANEANASIWELFISANAQETLVAQPDKSARIALLNGRYILPLNTIEIPKPGVINIERLIGPTSNVVKLPGDEDIRWAGQCVNFVKYALRDLAPEMSGNAEDWERYVNSTVPSVGSVVVLRVGSWGHIGIVVASESNKIIVRSRNWMGLWTISDNEFDVGDKRIVGYITF